MSKIQLRPRAIRTVFLIVGMLMFFAGYVLRLAHLQLLQHQTWDERSRQNHMTQRILEMKRGTISDRNGVEFALSVETYSVFLYMREVKSLEETAKLLATVIPVTPDEIIAKTQGKKGYIKIIENLERPLANKVKTLNLSGVNIEEHFRRFYPQNSLCSNIIGFVGKDGVGLEGLEMQFDQVLRGYSGLAVQEDVSLGQSTGSGGRLRILQAPMGGSNLTLSIDSFIQHILESELANVNKEYSPIDTTAIAMDPATGDILGMAVFPNYNLNDFGNASSTNRRNRPVVDLLEPGSSMKIFAMAAGLDSGVLDAKTRFYCRGYGEMEGRRMKCHGRHGLVNVNEAIAQSCNSAMMQVSQMVERNQLYRTYRLMGFGETTGLKIPGESPGLLRPPSRWSGFSASSLCIGQEMMVTPLQLATAYCAIANDGWLLEPRLVTRIFSPHKQIDDELAVLRRRRVFSATRAAHLRKMLMGVVEDGTAKQAKLEDYTVGGKTSTAQKANPRGGYFTDKLAVSFVGIAPVSAPRIVLIVVVNEPKGPEKSISGGKVAGPVFARIMDRILKYLKVPPDKKEVYSLGQQEVAKADTRVPSEVTRHSENVRSQTGNTQPTAKIPLQHLQIAATTRPVMPDLRGRSLKEVIRLVRGLNVKAVFAGNGLAVTQSPEPGFPLVNDHLVSVTFSATGNL